MQENAAIASNHDWNQRIFGVLQRPKQQKAKAQKWNFTSVGASPNHFQYIF